MFTSPLLRLRTQKSNLTGLCLLFCLWTCWKPLETDTHEWAFVSFFPWYFFMVFHLSKTLGNATLNSKLYELEWLREIWDCSVRQTENKASRKQEDLECCRQGFLSSKFSFLKAHKQYRPIRPGLCFPFFVHKEAISLHELCSLWA